jgi:glutathione peroxidase
MVDQVRRTLGMVAALGAALAPFRPDPAAAAAAVAWDFTFDGIEGEPIALADHRGKTLLVVNTASFCGFTGQYAGLRKLHETYGPQGLVVIGVPSGDFRQEKDSNEAVKQFCEVEFGIDFPLAAITRVTGREAHPFYRWAANAAAPPRWNFHKYLVGRDGRIAGSWGATTAPESSVIRTAIERALASPAA